MDEKDTEKIDFRVHAALLRPGILSLQHDPVKLQWTSHPKRQSWRGLGSDHVLTLRSLLLSAKEERHLGGLVAWLYGCCKRLFDVSTSQILLVNGRCTFKQPLNYLSISIGEMYSVIFSLGTAENGNLASQKLLA